MARILKSVPLLQPGVDRQGDLLEMSDLQDLVSRINSRFMPFRVGHSACAIPIGFFENAVIGSGEQGVPTVFADLVCFRPSDVRPIARMLQRPRNASGFDVKPDTGDVRFTFSSNSPSSIAEEIVNELNGTVPCEPGRELVKSCDSIDLTSMTLVGIALVMAGQALAGFSKRVGEKAYDEVAKATQRVLERIQEYWRTQPEPDPSTGASVPREFVIRLEGDDSDLTIEFVVNDDCTAEGVKEALSRLHRLMPSPQTILPESIQSTTTMLVFEWIPDAPGPGWFVSYAVTRSGQIYSDKEVSLADGALTVEDFMVSIGATSSPR